MLVNARTKESIVNEPVPASQAQPVAAAPAAAALEAPRFADPTALGLFGLAIGCAALLPIAFGMKSAATVDGLRAAAMICLLFGGGCQFLAGLMSFANKNMLGGTLLTTFSFNWVINWWTLDGIANGKMPNASISLAVDLCFVLIFVAMTYAFAFYSKLLVVFLLDIDVLYALRIIREVAHMPSLGLAIAIASTALMFLALYIAVALVLVNASGKSMLPMGGPMLGANAGGPAKH